MAKSPNFQLHDLHHTDMRLSMTTGSYLTIDVTNDGDLNTAELFISGDTDRQRINNALAIADRIRNAALDLSASLVTGRSGTVRSDGTPVALPDAAPLHGTQVRAA